MNLTEIIKKLNSDKVIAYKLRDNFYFTEYLQKWSSNRKVSFSSTQPTNGRWLYVLDLFVGARMFNDDKKAFNEFINKLKSYNPDFSDSVNNKYYWYVENAENISNDAYSIYREIRRQYHIL